VSVDLEASWLSALRFVISDLKFPISNSLIKKEFFTMNAACTRVRRQGPLTEEQRRLAQAYLPLARRLARPLKRALPGAVDEIESAAHTGLVFAARAYDPRHNLSFATYARHRILWTIHDALRRLEEQANYPRNRRRRPGRPRLRLHHEIRRRVVAAREEPPVGTLLEATETVESWLRRLPRRNARVCRLIYLDEKSQVQVAMCLGYSRARISRLHRESLAMLGESLRGRLDP
jgi:RNA polymerase sigma factor (sigma-70 family)